MNTYTGKCDVSKENETIWVEMLNAGTPQHPNNAIVGLMIDCTYNKRTGAGLCKECNLYKDLP